MSGGGGCGIATMSSPANFQEGSPRALDLLRRADDFLLQTRRRIANLPPDTNRGSVIEETPGRPAVVWHTRHASLRASMGRKKSRLRT
ncbi:hypothetical protein E4U26_005855 [Claviceps purpurea]|nr:hypothetical protein E4U26_005855 [Claviceps purpurea]